jgi:hypothetical protein
VKSLAVFAGCLCGILFAVPCASGPLQDNIQVLEQRARSKRANSRPAVRPARKPIRRAAAIPFVYRPKRFGVRSRNGDLVVRASAGDALAHVYVKMRLVSTEGNGQASLPDLSPGRYPVLVWAPELRRRRTFWVNVRPGRVTELKASL